MNRVFTIQTKCWWDQSGCSCCDATKMEYYVVTENGDEVQTNGTPHSREDVYFALLELLEVEVVFEEDTKNDQLSAI